MPWQSPLTNECRIIRMTEALRGIDISTEGHRTKAYREAGIEAIEPGDDAKATHRAEIYRTRVMVQRLPKARNIIRGAI